MSDCPRLHYLFGGCKFEGRYDYRLDADRLKRLGAMLEIMSEDQLTALTEETYVHDVCVRCGKTSPRPTDTRKAP